MIHLNRNSTGGGINPSDIGLSNVKAMADDFASTILYIMHYVNAPIDAKCFVTSGATEGIATFVHWALSQPMKGGKDLGEELMEMYAGSFNLTEGLMEMYAGAMNRNIVGTTFDHPSVKDNVINYGGAYEFINSKNVKDAAGVVLTHVDGKTGSILNIDNFWSNTKDVQGLVLLDASQSIGKLNVDMRRAKADACIFSLHKLGFDKGLGLFIFTEKKKKFVPLIAGKQQHGYRGGTLDLFAINGFTFPKFTFPSKIAWEKAVKQIEDAGISVIKPRKEHLHDTILIQCKKNVLQIINTLYQNGIETGTSSSCLQGADNLLRITAEKDSDFSNEVISKIVKAIKSE